MNQLFRTKALSHEAYAASGLRRCLSAFDLTLLGIGAIIGTGIFVLTGITAATQSGPAVVMSYVIAGVACVFAALAYAELSAAVGGCGSAYGYSYAAFGEFFAWIIGWDLILEYGFATAAVANGWAGYLKDGLTAVGLGLPRELTSAPCHVLPPEWTHTLNGIFSTIGFSLPQRPETEACRGAIMNLPAAGIILVLMVLLAIGVKQSARTNAIMVYIKLATVAVFVGVAVFFVNAENWSPFLPFGWLEWVGEGADRRSIGAIAGASVVFFAYIGFDAVTTAAEETGNPQRDLPTGIIASLAICTVLYIVVSALMTGVVSYKELNVSSPASHALLSLGMNAAAVFVAVGVIIGLVSVMLVLYYGLTRIIFAMSRDGLLSPFFASVLPMTQTPVRVIVLCGVVMACIAGVMPLGELAELVNIGTLAAFVMVCMGVIVLRFTRPELRRPFRIPFSPLVPLLGAVCCFLMMLTLPPLTWARFGGWLIIGLVIYFAYSLWHSKLATAQA